MTFILPSLPSLLRRSLPHIGAIALFLSINGLFFYPQFQGKQIGQDDLLESDGQVRELALYKEATGRQPLWTNNIYVGQPAFYTGVQYPNPLWVVERGLQLFFGRPVNVFFLSMLSTYLALLVFGVNPWVAAIGGVSFGMSTNNVILFQAGHMMKIGSLMYMPFIIAGLYSITRKKYLQGFVLYALGLAMSILHHHVQMIYYLMLALLIMGAIYLVQWIREKDYTHVGKAFAIVLLGTTIAVGSNLSRMWTSYEFAAETIRGKDILEPVAEQAVNSAVNPATRQATNPTTNPATDPTPSPSEPAEGLDWEYAMAWSNNTLDVLSGLIPGIVGGSSGQRMSEGASYTALRRAGVGAQADGGYRLPLYWGNLPFTSGPIYFGAGVVFLFVLGLFLVKGPVKWWLASATLLTVLLSYGDNQAWLNRFLFDYFPLFNKFRTPNSVLSVTAILIAMMAALGVSQWIRTAHQNPDIPEPSQPKKRAKKAKSQWILKGDEANYLYAALGITAGLSAIIALFGPSLFSFQGSNDAAYAESGLLPFLLQDRKALLVGDAWRSTLFILATASLLWVFAAGKLAKEWALAGIILIIIADFWGINRRYIHPSDFEESREQIIEDYYIEREVDREIRRLESADGEYNRGDYRVLDLSINTFNTNRTTYYHNTIGGYTAVKLQRIQDMIDLHISRFNPAVLNMLNTRYIINRNGQLIVNNEALGWAWFVRNIQQVQTNREEIEALNGFSPAETAVVHAGEFGSYLEGFQPNALHKDGLQADGTPLNATITRTDYELDYWAYAYSTDSEQLAVFSEMWYNPEKGLHAYVNGVPAEFIRVNYMLRAIRVPAGEGIIEFRFEPSSYIVGSPVTQAFAWVVILALVGWIGFQVRRSVSDSTGKTGQIESGYSSPSQP